MTQTPPSVGAEPAIRPAPLPGPALQLAYATPQPKSAGTADFADVLQIMIRRIVFATGIGMLVGGLVYAFADNRRDDPAAMAGVGAGMVALVVPFRKLSEPVRLGRKD